jgi:hypothetical protein
MTAEQRETLVRCGLSFDEVCDLCGIAVEDRDGLRERAQALLRAIALQVAR